MDQTYPNDRVDENMKYLQYQSLSKIGKDRQRLSTDSFDKSNYLEQKVDQLAQMNEGLHSKIKDQSLLITQYSDQDKVMGGLQSEILDLRKQLKFVRRQKSQLHQDMLEDKRNNIIEREIEIRKKQFQDDLRQKTQKIGLISEVCDELNREQRMQNDRIKQKNEEIKALIEENDYLRRFKKEYNEQSLKIQGMEVDNKDLKDRVKSLQEDMSIFQTEKKDTQSRLKEEINKLKLENNDLMETINNQLVEISDCINLTNKYKDIILNQQKSLEVGNQTRQETNEIILALDELVRSSSKQKSQYLVFQGDTNNTYDMLYILKNNVITLTKSYQDLKHQKNKYKNKCGHYVDEIKDLKESQQLSKIEIEKLKTEKLLLQQQFEQTVVMMEQQINERNIEEMKLKQQLNDISSQIQCLDREMEEKEFKRYQTTAYQFGSYVNILHTKVGKLLNIKQISSSFIVGYMKLLDKINNLTKQLACMSPLVSIKQRAIRKLKKIFKVVYFASLIKSRRCVIKADLNTVGQVIKQSQKGIHYIEKLDFYKDFSQIIIQLNVQQQEYYPQIINQQESTKIFNQIEQNISTKINNKDDEITLLQQKFIKINEEVETFVYERQTDQKLILELKKKLSEQELEIKQIKEENNAINEKLKFHRKHFVEENNRNSSQYQSQDNDQQNNHNNGASTINNNGLSSNQQNINRNSKNIFTNIDDIQARISPSMLGSRNASSELLNKFKFNESNFDSQMASPIVKNSASNFGSYDYLKFQSSQRNSHAKTDINKNNIYVAQEDREQQHDAALLTSNKKQAYLELKKQQQILQDKLSSNQNEIEKIRSNSQSKFLSASKRNSLDVLQDQLKQNQQDNFILNQINNQSNSNNLFRNLNTQSQPGLQSIRTNSINNQSSFGQGILNSNAHNNNYTFNNNSSAQLIFSDSQRKTKTIQDQLKQELIESQKYSKFLTQQQ